MSANAKDKSNLSRGLFKKSYPTAKRDADASENSRPTQHGKKRGNRGEKRKAKLAKLDTDDVIRFTTKKHEDDVEIKVAKKKLYAKKAVLCGSSAVLSRKLEGTDKLDLKDQSLKAVVWLLNFLHTRCNDIKENQATALLPLAIEYEMEELKEKCITTLKKSCYRRPKLEYVTIAERHDLSELLTIAICACASLLNYGELRKQRDLPENESLSTNTYYKIYEVEQDMYGVSEEEESDEEAAAGPSNQ